MTDLFKHFPFQGHDSLFLQLHFVEDLLVELLKSFLLWLDIIRFSGHVG